MNVSINYEPKKKLVKTFYESLNTNGREWLHDVIIDRRRRHLWNILMSWDYGRWRVNGGGGSYIYNYMKRVWWKLGSDAVKGDECLVVRWRGLQETLRALKRCNPVNMRIRVFVCCQRANLLFVLSTYSLVLSFPSGWL